MTARDSGVVVLFVPRAGSQTAVDYGRRIGRLRWRRAVGAERALAPDPGAPAGAVLQGARYAVVVRDERAIPATLTDPPKAWADPIQPALPLAPAAVPVHTLREMEAFGAEVSDAAPLDRSCVPAVAVDLQAVGPRQGETIADFARRLWEDSSGVKLDPLFRAVVLDDPPEFDRSELLARLPAETRRLCDVGCAGGASGHAFARRAPGVHVTGIENAPRAAVLARRRLDRVLEEDALAALERLEREGETFDAFLFADVLEHLPEPVAALAAARRIAAPGAVLVASVPNVGHLSLVRDLVLGRFDVLPAGLADAGHLRWFDRRLLEEVLEEAGWHVDRIESLAGAPPPDPETFLSHFSGWPALDRASLQTYQWIAVADANSRQRGAPKTPEQENSFLSTLDAPKYSHLRFGAANRFQGLVLDLRGGPSPPLRVSIDGRFVAEFPCDRPSEDVARHLPAFAAARTCRFDFELHVPDGASTIDFDASGQSPPARRLFRYDLLRLRRSPAELTGMERGLDSLPAPSPEIVFLTQGHHDVAGYRDSIIPGHINTRRYLSEAGVQLDRIEDVLDFGCGSGRTLTGWYLEGGQRRLRGCDTNEALVSWARENLPSAIRVDRTGALPPLTYPDAHFDLVTAISVFTHLRFDSQQRWARELARVLKPGGILLLTLHGEPYVRLFLGDRLRQFEEMGHVEVEASADGANESASFHSPKALDELFPQFEVLRRYPCGQTEDRSALFLLAAWQDVYVLRLRGAPATGSPEIPGAPLPD